VLHIAFCNGLVGRLVIAVVVVAARLLEDLSEVLEPEFFTVSLSIEQGHDEGNITCDLADYIEAQAMSHVRGAPLHPQTQGKIERLHQTLKNRILLENYFLPGDLEAQIGAFVEHCNHQHYHESLDNVTPADAYFGRAAPIIKQRERIKRQTIQHRRLQQRKIAA
jgi:Integrase core domain